MLEGNDTALHAYHMGPEFLAVEFSNGLWPTRLSARRAAKAESLELQPKVYQRVRKIIKPVQIYKSFV